MRESDLLFQRVGESTTSAAHPSRFNDERRAKSSRAESAVSVARGTAGRN